MIPNKELSAERIVNYTEKAYRRVDEACIGSERHDTVLEADGSLQACCGGL